MYPDSDQSVYVVCPFIFKLESSVIEIVDRWKLPIFGTRTQIDADLKAGTYVIINSLSYFPHFNYMPQYMPYVLSTIFEAWFCFHEILVNVLGL